MLVDLFCDLACIAFERSVIAFHWKKGRVRIWAKSLAVDGIS